MADKIILTAEQQAAAFCGKNAVVAAGAGSGKTMVLARRYVWLITEKKLRTPEILCLTFTNKAAAEMYQRIYRELRIAAAGEDSDKSKSARQALEEFSLARIQTMDSYCGGLVRQCASRYGINPEFTIDEDRCRALAKEQALSFLITHCREPAIQKLYQGKRPRDLAAGFFLPILNDSSYIERGPGFAANIRRQCGIVCAEWGKMCGAINTNLEELSALIGQNDYLLPNLQEVLNTWREFIFPSEKQICEYLDSILELPQAQCMAFSESHPLRESIAGAVKFIGVINSISHRNGQRKDNPVKDLIKQFFKKVFPEFSALAVFCLQAGWLISLSALVQVLQGQYLDKKRGESILTFNDAARLARTILLEQYDIRDSEKRTFREIMIDEFQDNNELQRDLLFLLAEKESIMKSGVPQAQDLCEDKLFFVGDEKQSIFRFRGADVSVFKKLKNDLNCGELSLAVNYRSSPDLIGAFNAIFSGSVFDPDGKTAGEEHPAVFIPLSSDRPENDAIPPYEAAYTALRPGKSGNGKISICIFDKSKIAAKDDDEEADTDDTEMDPAENEARFIAERIQLLLKQKDENGKSVYLADDIAILFRKHSAQNKIEKQLRLLNIPYSSEDLGDLFAGGAVDDLMSVLRLAAYPADKTAYAQMLRSPFAGLSLAGLALCMARFSNDGQAEVFDDTPLADLSETDQSRYLRGRDVYQYIREKSCQESISALISELWYNLGYRYETQWNPRTAVYSELYDYLFHLAAKADLKNQGLAAFTDAIREIRNSGQRIDDIEIPMERSGAVRLMTLYKSKGLEFPVVFLCGCGTIGKGDQRGAVFNTQDAGPAISPPVPDEISGIDKIGVNYFWETCSDEMKQKQTAELRRLLYVGMTRAEKEVYISGCLDIRKFGQNSEEGPIGDFSLLVKNYTENRIENFIKYRIEKNKKPHAVPWDSIIDNDTFFGLCLPALASHIPAAGLEKAPSFFTIEEIPAYADEDAPARETQAGYLANNQTGLNTFIENTNDYYKSAAEIPVPVFEENRFTPTSAPPDTVLQAQRLASGVVDALNRGTREPLEPRKKDGAQYQAATEFSGEDAADVFIKVDAALARFAKTEKEDTETEKFSAASFGTIAHACVEAQLKHKEAEIPFHLRGFLTPKESSDFLDAGNEIAQRFIRSPLGKIAGAAGTSKSEFPFRTLLLTPDGSETFINGTIDLLFEDTDTVYVVDFKTDSRENPEDHAAQMTCYRYAAYELLAKPHGKKCRVFLYYLRTGRAYST
ncbi:MAG: UvrD-helicase domain-containing protein [Treponema sp.]|nr:UvrD-helicase domain-containing protein [Treponema sp.]